MENQNPDDKDSVQSPANSALSNQVGPSSAGPAVYAGEKEVEKIEKEMSSFEHSTLRWARTAVIMSFLAAVFVCGQWWEMHTSSADTHNLAQAAGDQATWTQRLSDNAKVQSDKTQQLADRMKDQADRTRDLADQAVKQTKAAQTAAEAAMISADIGKQSLELTERPWLVVTANIASPLTYDKEGAHITLHYSILNVGHTPATHVNVWPEFYIANGKKADAILERRKHCDDVAKRGFGEVVYPNQTYEINEIFSAPQAELEESLHYFGNDFFVADIVDCVAYRANFSPNAYTVGTSYNLAKPGPIGVRLSFPPFVEMPLGSLALMPSGFSSKDAQ